MKKSEKLLAAGLAVVVVLWLGWPMVRSIVFDPIEERTGRRDLVQGQVDKKERTDFEIKLSKRKLEDWAKISLPGDPLTAQRLYQEWLTDLAQLAGLSYLKVTPTARPPKRKTYTAIQVTVEGEGTFEQLNRFLYHFRRAKLMHRITRLTIRSEESVGNPYLTIKMTAEGLSMTGAKDRRSLFPETELNNALAADENETKITVRSTDGFPQKAPFRIRVGYEYMTVEKTDGKKWTVKRGVEFTFADEHRKSDIVESAPVNPEIDVKIVSVKGKKGLFSRWNDPITGTEKTKSTKKTKRSDAITVAAKTKAKLNEDFARTRHENLIKNSPFVKADLSEYKLQLNQIGELTVTRGIPLTLQAQISDPDTAAGKARFSLEAMESGKFPEGITINKDSGDINWTPPEKYLIGSYEVRVVVKQSGQVDEQRVSIRFREPNTAPVVAAIPSQIVFHERPVSVQVKATDSDEPKNTLSYTIADPVPAGASIDAATGLLTWAPPLTIETGEQTITVVVTDNGEPAQTMSLPIVFNVQEDTARFTHLTGSVAVDGDRRAWLYDRLNNRSTIVRKGVNVQIADISGLVLDVGKDFVTLQNDEGTWRLELGKTLRELEKIAEAPKAAVEPQPADSEKPAVAEKTVTQSEPTDEQPAAKQPTAAQPVAIEQPAVEQPATDE